MRSAVIHAAAIIAVLIILLSLRAVSAQSQPNLFQIRVIAPSMAYPGEDVNIFIETTYNGTLVGYTATVAFEAYVWLSGQKPMMLLPDPTECCIFPSGAYAPGHFNTTWTVPMNVTIGSVEWVQVPGSYEGFSAAGVAGITMVPQWLLSTSGAEPGTDALVAYAALALAIVLVILAVGYVGLLVYVGRGKRMVSGIAYVVRIASPFRLISTSRHLAACC